MQMTMIATMMIAVTLIATKKFARWIA